MISDIIPTYDKLQLLDAVLNSIDAHTQIE